MGEENQRETKILKTSNGYKIKVSTYITGRELRHIQEVFFDEIQLKQVGKEQEIGTTMKSKQIAMAEDRSIETVVKSIDDKTDDIVNKILDLPAVDFGEIKEYIDKLSEKKKPSEKQN